MHLTDVPMLLQSLHPAALDQTGNLSQSRCNALDYSRPPVAPPRLKVSHRVFSDFRAVSGRLILGAFVKYIILDSLCKQVAMG